MLRALDSTEFLKVQPPEIQGLEKMNVFQYCPISELPPKARLLSAIWSYNK
jgi:hypothetical protein